MTEVDALGAYTPEDTDEIKEQELWSLDATLTNYILPRIKAFREMKRHGYPVTDPLAHADNDDSQAERDVADWENVLHDIENAFQLLKDGERWDRSKAQHEAITKGLGLFAKHYEHLWD